MRAPHRVRWIVALTVVAWLVVLAPAGAYVDPGSQTMLFQAVVAGLATAGLTLKLTWRRIRAFFSRSATDSETDPATDPTTEPAISHTADAEPVADRADGE